MIQIDGRWATPVTTQDGLPTGAYRWAAADELPQTTDSRALFEGDFDDFVYWCISYAMARGHGILDVDRRIKRLCLIREGERGYTRSMLSRFTRRVGAERLRLIIEEKVVTLLRRSRVEEVNAVPDASSVKAWSTRHPRDSRRGFSDMDAMVGRDGCGYDLGYKLHISVEHERILPLAGVLVPANEKRQAHSSSRG
jgi:hypothetical protein